MLTTYLYPTYIFCTRKYENIETVLVDCCSSHIGFALIQCKCRLNVFVEVVDAAAAETLQNSTVSY